MRPQPPAMWSTSIPTGAPSPMASYGGDQFRLIFLSSTQRKPNSTNIADYNTFVQDLAAAGHTGIQPYADGFKVVGCTAAVDARDNTATTFTNANKGSAHLLAEGKQGSRQLPGLLRRQLGRRGKRQDRAWQQRSRYLTGRQLPGDRLRRRRHRASFGGDQQALGDTGEVRLGNPNDSNSSRNPLSGQGGANRSINRHMYGLSQVFELIQLPSNAGTLTTGGTPRTGSISGSDVGEYWQVKLHQNGKYRIDVKGSESSQYGGTLTNPRIKLLAGNSRCSSC